LTNSTDPASFQPTKALLCLLAASLFWLLNALNKTGYSLNIDYPIHFVYNDSAYCPVTTLPRTVRVNVSGDGWGLLRHSWLPFQTDPIDYPVSQPLRASVINTSSLTASLAEQIKRLKVNYVVADTVDIAFDRRVTKTILLRVDSTSLNLAPGYAVSSVINVTPGSVAVTGPQRLVRGLPDTLRLRIPRKRIVDNYDEELLLTQFRHPQLRTSANRVLISFEVGQLLSLPSSLSTN